MTLASMPAFELGNMGLMDSINAQQFNPALVCHGSSERIVICRFDGGGK